MTRWTTMEVRPISEADTAKATIVFVEEGASHRLAPSDAIVRLMRQADFVARPGRWLDLVECAGRTLVVGVASAGQPDRWRSAGGHLVEAMRSLGLTETRVPSAAELGPGGEFVSLIEGVLLHSFRLDQGRRDPVPGHVSEVLLIAAEDAALLAQAKRRADPVNRARAWVEQPANLLTPAIFADEADAALSPLGVNVRRLGPAELEAMGAGGILAVAAGSDNEPRLTVAEYRGAPGRAQWDAALIGKGLTFDAGGLNLKPRPGIAKMKFDMGGGAAVLGALERLAAREAAVNVVAIVPMCENTIDGRAFRPGDVIRSLAGLTIDVQDTDAEGRIVLADGIAYAIEHYDPAHIVDVATLTGAIMGVLHEDFAGLFASDDALAGALAAAGADANELLWRLPLVAAQDYLVESPVADVSNLGAPGWFGAGSGSPAAGAKFLEKFAKGRSWAHIDIAGTAWAGRRTTRCGPGATGF
ncbi:MAG: leucyl aminopeptidase family protein, partial [Tsuneonella sp.]